MAILVTPTLQPVQNFDAALAYTFAFSVQGGDQVVANRLIIKNNSTLAEVYNSGKVDSLSLLHTLPANTSGISNGVYYQATITTYNENGDASTPSSAVLFIGSATATLTIANVTPGQIINNAAFTFRGTSTASSENYRFDLLDSAGNVISTNYAVEDGLSSGVYNYHISLSGLVNGSSYSIRFYNWTNVRETVTVAFSVAYMTPESSITFYVDNKCYGGYIEVDNYLHPIESEFIGEEEGATPTYVDNDTAISLGDDESVVFSGGIGFTEEYQLAVWERNLQTTASFLTWSDSYHQVLTAQQITSSGQVQVRVLTLWDENPVDVTSNSIPTPASTDHILINIYCKSGVYSCTIENRGTNV